MSAVAEKLQPVIQEEFSPQRADRYLRVYNADIDWMPHMLSLNRNLVSKLGQEKGSQQTRQQISCAILLPSLDPSVISDPPQNLLFWCGKYNQFKERDWEQELRQVWKKDDEIDKSRADALDLGIIFPLVYVPIARQAFNWLMDKVTAVSLVAPDTDEYRVIEKKMQNLVYAYGGAVVCSIFLKPELRPRIARIPNWRSGYFFEKLIFEVYKPNEILKIKDQELKKVDKNLVKKIRTT